MPYTSRVLIFFYLIILLSSPLSAEGQNEPAVEDAESRMAVLDETKTSVTFKEADGNAVILPKMPKRTIVCQNSIMDLWYMAGGVSLARVRGSVNVPAEAIKLPQLGTINTINSELIMELEPDLLIFTDSDAQIKMRAFFEKEGIPSVVIKYNTYEDFRVILDLFTRLNNTREIYTNTVIPIEKQVQNIINQVPLNSAPPTICILFASTKYVKVETQNTITGYICEKLGAKNIYTDNTVKGATRVELSLEYIMEQDPDIIFVTTLGDIEKCKSRIDRDIKSSDIWGDLSAVKNERFIYLDKSHAIYKPNRFYPEAFKIMAEHIYPGVEFEELTDE